MSFPTVPAFVHNDDWNSESRKHPAMEFMERYTNKFDEGLPAMGAELDKWHPEDFVYTAANGTVTKGM